MGIRILGLMAIVVAVLLFYGCDKESKAKRESFVQVGEFALREVAPGIKEARDGAGRTLILVPREVAVPSSYSPDQVVRIPVRRVVAYGFFDVAVLRALGVLEDVLVGVTSPLKDWYIPEVRQGLASGKITFVGEAPDVDFERIKNLQPDLVLTWDPSIIPILSELNIPCAVTSSPYAMCLNARIRFVEFIAPFFNKEDEAGRFVARVKTALEDIKVRTASFRSNQPRVMWGDIYEKRVLVEPGNSWVAELVDLASGDYLLDDVFGSSCIEIAVERFLQSGHQADILFTYRTPQMGVTSKEALARTNPLLKDLKPFTHGEVYVPLPHFSQSGDRLDEILTEIAAILHPEAYGGYKLKYFMKLPEKDPATERKDS